MVKLNPFLQAISKEDFFPNTFVNWKCSQLVILENEEQKHAIGTAECHAIAGRSQGGGWLRCNDYPPRK